MAEPEKNDYDAFDALAYADKKYSSMSEWMAIPLKGIHEAFESYCTGEKRTGLRVLEYGCGPVPVYLCSAPRFASEIVFADFAKSNTDALQQWVNDKPGCPDYTHFFEYVIKELEGCTDQASLATAVSKRQADLRSMVKGVVFCDITQDNPIESGYEGPYDVIYSSLCLCVAATNIKEYSDNVKRLTKLLKPGGMLIINDVEARDLSKNIITYTVNNNKFEALCPTSEALCQVLEENGYHDIKTSRNLIDDTQGAAQRMSPEVLAMRFIVAKH